jgi:transposase
MPDNKLTNFEGSRFFIGLDVHKKSWSVTIRTLGMELVHFTQEPSVSLLARYLNRKYPGAEFRSAYEAGFCGTSIHHELCRAGIHNIIIHPADLPKTDKLRKNKNDHQDSRAIARYLESGLLTSIHIMSDEQQQRRSLFRLRQVKVQHVARCSNRLRSFINYFNIEVDQSFPKTGYIANRFLDQLSAVEFITEEGLYTLHQYIEELRYQRKQLCEVTKKLRKSISSIYREQYVSAISVPGIGPIVASALFSEIGDFSRFGDPDTYTSYLGLIPAERSSGESIHIVRLQPRCNTYLRPLLIESAWVAIRKCPTLLAYYKKHAHKNEKKAIIKVARKLALIVKGVIIHASQYNSNYRTNNTF